VGHGPSRDGRIDHDRAPAGGRGRSQPPCPRPHAPRRSSHRPHHPDGRHRVAGRRSDRGATQQPPTRHRQRHRATITRIDPDHRAIDATTDDGRTVVLTRDYLDAGHVTHGYAITGHKAQGLTVDHTYVLGSEALYREWGYVALSRGRHTNQLYQTVLDQHLDEIHHHVHQPDDPAASLAARVARSRMQESVTPEIAELAAQWRQLHARLHAPDIARQRVLIAERASLVRTLQADLAQLERLSRCIDHAASGLGRARSRRLLADLRDQYEERAAQVPRLDRRLREVEAELAGLPTDAQISQTVARWRDHARQLDETARARVAGYRYTAPDHLVTALGQPPANGPQRDAWEQAAADIETHRLRWGVTDPQRPLGPEPADPLQQAERRRVVRTIEHHHERTLGQARGRGRSLGIAISR
jgi:hypothetical protein